MRKLLTYLATLPSATTYEGLAARNFFGSEAELLDEALYELEGWDLLLFRDTSQVRYYEAHPILQGYAYDRKPRPAIGSLWLQSKAEIFWLTTRIARALAQGQPAPFDEALKDILPRLKNVTLMPDTIQVIGNDVIFSVQALGNNSQPVQIWVRTRTDKALAEKTLEERLLEARSNIHDKEPPTDEPEPTESGPTLMRVSSDTIAKVSTDQGAIMAAELGG